MKQLIISFLFAACFCTCGEKKQTVDFATLSKAELNAKSLEIPDIRMVDSLKHAHDSCMGFSFDANALLVNQTNNYSIGSIVNKKSLQILNTLNDLGLTEKQMMSEFNTLTNPCYEKRVLNLRLKAIIKDSFQLYFPNIDQALNKQISDAIMTSENAEIQTGSWLYIDMKDVLKKIIDTTKSPQGLRYKNNLMDTSNMVLTAVEGVTDVSFIIHTQNDISKPLEAFLKTKPSESEQALKVSIRLAYIDKNKFELAVNGFFPMVGQFSKAQMK